MQFTLIQLTSMEYAGTQFWTDALKTGRIPVAMGYENNLRSLNRGLKFQRRK